MCFKIFLLSYHQQTMPQPLWTPFLPVGKGWGATLASLSHLLHPAQRFACALLTVCTGWHSRPFNTARFTLCLQTESLHCMALVPHTETQPYSLAKVVALTTMETRTDAWRVTH